MRFSPQGKRYATFGPAADLNGDGVVDEWDQLVPLACKCEGMARVTAEAAIRHAALDWWLGLFVILINAVSTAGGVASTQNQSLTVVAAVLSALAVFMSTLRQVWQPAQKAAHCRAAQREMLGIADRVRFVAATKPANRPPEGGSAFFCAVEKQIDEAASRNDAVADAVAHWRPDADE